MARGVMVSVVDFKQQSRWFKADSLKKNCSFQNCVSFTELGAFVLLLCFNTNMCFFFAIHQWDLQYSSRRLFALRDVFLLPTTSQHSFLK
jgi:hypothetical protein